MTAASFAPGDPVRGEIVAAKVVPGEPASPATPDAGSAYAGLITRAIGFVIDVALIDLVAAIVAVGAALVGSLFYFPKDLHPLWVVLGVTAFVLWSAGYFVAFWSTTGQTPGARMMQIRVVTADGETLRPRRAAVRVIGLILASLPLFLGFLPILFDGKRRGLQDYLARSRVVSSPQLSLAQVKRDQMRARRRARPPASDD